MSDLALDIDGDIYLDETGDLAVVEGADSIQSYLLARLNTFYGEWFLDNRIGVPYFQQILKKNPDPVIVDSAIKQVIINTPGIIELTEFSIDLDSSARVLSVDFKVISVDGEIDFSGEFPNG